MITVAHTPDLLEYQWLDGDQPAGQVRWELVRGTGHGARLILTQTGAAATADLQQTALSAWKTHLQELADELARRAAWSGSEPDFPGRHSDLTVGDTERGGPEGAPERESPRGYGGPDR